MATYLFRGIGSYNSNSYTNVLGRSDYYGSKMNWNDNISAIAQAAADGGLPSASNYGPSNGCTWWASGRSALEGGPNYSGGGNATNWWSRLGSDRYSADNVSASDFAGGDVLVFDGHVLYIEAVGGDTMYVSEAADGTNNHNIVIMSAWSISDFLNKKKHWWWNESFQGILKGNGSGGGGLTPSPVKPDSHPSSGYAKFKLEVVGGVDYMTSSYTISDIVECGEGIAGNQTGTQDEPLAPTEMSMSTDRENQRWEPFNMYTYERTETYDNNHNPVWSDWEQKYYGSQNLMLGEQPSYGNGWEMDWGDE